MAHQGKLLLLLLLLPLLPPPPCSGGLRGDAAGAGGAGGVTVQLDQLVICSGCSEPVTCCRASEPAGTTWSSRLVQTVTAWL